VVWAHPQGGEGQKRVTISGVALAHGTGGATLCCAAHSLSSAAGRLLTRFRQ
jgi:hypothetical protein